MLSIPNCFKWSWRRSLTLLRGPKRPKYYTLSIQLLSSTRVILHSNKNGSREFISSRSCNQPIFFKSFSKMGTLETGDSCVTVGSIIFFLLTKDKRCSLTLKQMVRCFFLKKDNRQNLHFMLIILMVLMIKYFQNVTPLNH